MLYQMKHSQHTVITQGVWAPGPKGEKLRRDGIPSLDGGLRGRRLWRSPVPLPTAMFSSHPKAPIHHWKPFSNDWRKSCSLRWNNEFFVAMENISENEGYSRNLSGYGNSIEHSQREMRSKLLNLPGAIHVNFIFLSKNLEVTFFKAEYFLGQ